MTHETWLLQKARMIDRFGERNFSKEFSLLVSLECRPLPDDVFVQMVNAMIGSRRPNDPPLIRDFRDARLAWAKRNFERDLQGAERAVNGPAQGGLKLYLVRNFPGCDTLDQAAEVRKHQIAIARANDPDYHPMADKKWMGPLAWRKGSDGNWRPPSDDEIQAAQPTRGDESEPA